MAKVIGLGGIFFKSSDHEALGTWYRTWLDLPVGPYGATLRPEALPPGGWQVWSAFPADTGGATVLPQHEEGEYGRFGWFLDPDGNKVELWQPPAVRPGDVAGD